MRAWIIASALLLAACDASVTDDLEGGPQEGYTIDIRGSDDAQLFVITAPDGKNTGAQVAGGQSALMDANAVRSFADMPEPAPVGEEVVSFRAPGVNFSLSGTDSGPGEDDGSVQMSFGADGKGVSINASDDPGGDSAHVRITGMSAEDVRRFIAEAEEISPAVQAEMLTALDLD